MLQLKNKTPLAAMFLAVPDPDGVESVYAIVKATFVLGDQVTLAEKQLPVALKDEFYGEPGKSSLKSISDLALLKPGTDVLLIGTAHAPGGNAAPQMDVSLKVGALAKTIRVVGNRVWKSGSREAKPSAPEPFEQMPLVWEKAYGGMDQTNANPPELQAENRNPVGAGFYLTNGTKKLEDLPLPNLEVPQQMIAAVKDRPQPAAFGPVCAHWEPRRKYAGTYDEAWQKQRAPYLPRDFDPRFFQVAPPDQVVAGYLQGGEPVEIRGATPSGSLRFALPQLALQVIYRVDGDEHVRLPALDTVAIEPDQARLTLVWRCVLPCDKKTLRVREIEVTGNGESERS